VIGYMISPMLDGDKIAQLLKCERLSFTMY